MSDSRPAPSNGLGIAGFIVSLVGLVLCLGLISPIGLLLSFIALFKRPRGFAIAGVILGLFGSLWIILFFLFIVMGVGLAAVGAMGSGVFEFTLDATKIHTEVREHYRINGAVPSTLAVLPLDPETLIDPWGAQYRYEIEADGQNYTLSTSGADGIWDTSDDYSVSKDASQP